MNLWLDNKQLGIKTEKKQMTHFTDTLLRAFDNVTFKEYGHCCKFLTTTWYTLPQPWPIRSFASRGLVNGIWSDHPHSLVSYCWYPTTSPEDWFLVSNHDRTWVLSNQMTPITGLSLLESRNMIDIIQTPTYHRNHTTDLTAAVLLLASKICC